MLAHIHLALSIHPIQTERGILSFASQRSIKFLSLPLDSLACRALSHENPLFSIFLASYALNFTTCVSRTWVVASKRKPSSRFSHNRFPDRKCELFDRTKEQEKVAEMMARDFELIASTFSLLFLVSDARLVARSLRKYFPPEGEEENVATCFRRIRRKEKEIGGRWS